MKIVIQNESFESKFYNKSYDRFEIGVQIWKIRISNAAASQYSQIPCIWALRHSVTMP